MRIKQSRAEGYIDRGHGRLDTTEELTDAEMVGVLGVGGEIIKRIDVDHQAYVRRTRLSGDLGSHAQRAHLWDVFAQTSEQIEHLLMLRRRADVAELHDHDMPNHEQLLAGYLTTWVSDLRTDTMTASRTITPKTTV